MKRRDQGFFRILVLALFLILHSPRIARSWGHQAHELVNAAAIENLPEPLRSYFRTRKSFLVAHASDPDRLVGQDPSERPHHFTAAEAYDRYPFPRLNKRFVDERRGPSRLELGHGDAIWQIEQYTLKLAEALRKHRWADADRAAVFAAHYACDLTQPLHTVLNYDGQLTHQAGVHGRFESDLVNALYGQWALKPAPASYVPDLRARIFRELLESYRRRESVFAADRNAVTGRTYIDPAFMPAFQKLAGPLADERLEDAVSFVSSLWYTAWVRAGRPRLPPAGTQE